MPNNNAINFNSATSLSVSQGGTGDNTLTIHGVLVGAGTSPVAALTAGTTGQLLVATTGANPAFAASANGDFTFTTATASSTRTLTVSNTNNSNTASSADLALSVGTFGAPSLDMDINGVNTWAFVGSSTDLELQRNTTDVIRFASTGERTFINQASAAVRKTVTTSNATGDGTNATVTGYNASALFNRDSFWGGSTSFSAQDAGIYLISCQGSVSSTAAMTSGLATIATTSHIMLFNQCKIGTIRNASNNFSGVRGTALVNMAAGDTAIFTIKFSGSTKTASIQGVTGANVISYFCGAKIA